MSTINIFKRNLFQENCGGSKQFPVLYADEKTMKMVQHVFNMMAFEYDGKEDAFKIYNMQYMFKVMRNIVAGDEIWPSDTFSVREIEKDVNAHAKGISCEVNIKI